ncbi:MAG TPA: DUF1269 domain-containing protein [Nocardioides sp.]|uniref:DUF1269 domain-containing protein n=1 Tax=Nocardioides sp. TaxID=35761 RepID=UPI002D7F13F2|nr:DUF1269 domain-containing protein [Nocardioides sp.]HET6653324.1 DUF1269 domain-containing protein [Nocardioides sp.]
MTAATFDDQITLSAWTFGTREGASLAAVALRDMTGRGLVQVLGAAIVLWGSTSRSPRLIRALTPGTTEMSPRPEFLDLLFGMTYAMPLLEASVVARHKEPVEALSGIGVDQTFTNRLRDRLVPGSSALLVLSERATVSRLRASLDEPERREAEYADADIRLDATDVLDGSEPDWLLG